MRRMSAALVAITAAIALSALAAPAWASKPASKSLEVSPTDTKAGQMVKVSGGGCKGITILIFLIDGKEFHRGVMHGIVSNGAPERATSRLRD